MRVLVRVKEDAGPHDALACAVSDKGTKELGNKHKGATESVAPDRSSQVSSHDKARQHSTLSHGWYSYSLDVIER